MRSPLSTLLTCLLVGLRLAAQTPAPLAPGQVIDPVVCAFDHSESYALYLPSNYTPAKRWPILYAFHPLALGISPVRLYKDAAEKYGYIVAGSNNSRNFSLEEASKAANAMWADTHARFPIDERQVYTTGFSGGARIAGLVALRCPQCKIAGVIAHGAGYPVSQQPAATDSLLYYFAVGEEDFNWPEVMTIRREREEHGSPYRVQTFPGPHSWAPAPVVEDAVAWITLKATQSGARAVDAAFVSAYFQKIQDQATDAEKLGDTLAQLAAYRTLVSDFSGLKDVHDFQGRLAALEKSPALKGALKREQEAIHMQQSLEQELSPKIAAFGDAGSDDRLALRTAIYDGMTSLSREAGHAKSEDKRLVRLRAFHSLWAQGIEAGQARLEAKDFSRAESYFRLMSEISPDEAWPHLLLAEAHAGAGDRRLAVKDLREAVKRGLKNPDILSEDKKLEALRSDADFQQIIAQLRTK